MSATVTHRTGTEQRRRSFAPLLVLAGLLATLALAMSTSGVMAGFTAGITNNANSVGSGTLLMQENQGATTCLSSAGSTVTTANAGTCSGINKYSGVSAAVPGTVYASTVSVRNTGSIAANVFTLTAGTCTASATASPAGTGTSTFCGKVNVTINNDTTGKCVYPAQATPCGTPANTATLTTLAAAGPVSLPTVAAGATHTFTFQVMLDNSVTNAHQGLTANQSLAWSFAN